MTQVKQLMQKIDGLEKETIVFLQEIIEMESPTTDREAVNRVAAFVRDKVEALGASTEMVPSGQEDRGDHLVARFSGRILTLASILCIAHTDTVWKHGTLKEMPFQIEGNRIYGPGIYDMKGAIVCLLMAIKTLQEHRDERQNVRSSVCLILMKKSIVQLPGRLSIN